MFKLNTRRLIANSARRAIMQAGRKPTRRRCSYAVYPRSRSWAPILPRYPYADADGRSPLPRTVRPTDFASSCGTTTALRSPTFTTSQSRDAEHRPTLWRRTKLGASRSTSPSCRICFGGSHACQPRGPQWGVYFFRVSKDPQATAAKISPAALSASVRIVSRGIPKSSCATLPVIIAASPSPKL